MMNEYRVIVRQHLCYYVTHDREDEQAASCGKIRRYVMNAR